MAAYCSHTKRMTNGAIASLEVWDLTWSGRLSLGLYAFVVMCSADCHRGPIPVCMWLGLQISGLAGLRWSAINRSTSVASTTAAPPVMRPSRRNVLAVCCSCTSRLMYFSSPRRNFRYRPVKTFVWNAIETVKLTWQLFLFLARAKRSVLFCQFSWSKSCQINPFSDLEWS